MSREIKQHPHLECLPQLKTIHPGNCFNRLKLRWKTIRDHRDTDFYWSLAGGPVSWFKNSGSVTELLLLVELNIPTPPGVKWTGHSLRRGGASAAHAIGVMYKRAEARDFHKPQTIMTVIDKSLASALLYIASFPRLHLLRCETVFDLFTRVIF